MVLEKVGIGLKICQRGEQSSTSGEAAEYNVVERKNFGVGGITLQITELWITRKNPLRGFCLAIPGGPSG